MTNKKNDDVIALQEAYANVYNEIVKPDRVFVGSQYFRKKWLPLLGPSLAWVILALRQHCYWNRETGEKRDWCLISQEELANEVGVSVATLKRLLKHEYAGKFIIDISHRYRYDRQKRKQVRRKSMYRIRMDDPLTPEDKVRLKELLAQKLAGLNIDPETGQVDILQLLDRLSETEVDDLQLNLSDRSAEQKPETVQDEISQSVSELAERFSQLLTGINGSDEPPASSDSQDVPPYANAVHIPADELRRFELPRDQVLVSANGGYLAVPIVEVIKRDVRRSGGRLSDQTRTECFYSVQDALDEGPEEWLPEEQERIDLMNRLEQELAERYQHLGAFTLEEALRYYFSPQLAAKFLTGKSAVELRRIEGWLAYTRQATGLKNASGFLRSRLESDELPPNLEKTI